MKYVHTNIVTTDWKSLSDFYIKTFQCSIVPPIRNQKGEWLDKGTGVQHAHLSGVHLRLPGYGDSGPTLEIYQYAEIDQMREIDPNTRGFGHIAFEVDNVQHVADAVVKNGGRLNGEVTIRKIDGVGEITFVYARDPDGNIIELQHWSK